MKLLLDHTQPRNHNKYFVKIFLFFLSLAFFQCKPKGKEGTSKLTIESVKIFDSFPSGSGMAIKDDSLYLISDDAPFIYVVSIANGGTRKFNINGLETKYRLPKETKPDFESAVTGKFYGQESVIAFGSGSKTPGRDGLLVVNSSGQVYSSLTDLYKYLRKKTNTSLEQWNIEGAAVVGDSLFLLNRGNNMVITISWSNFTNYFFTFQNFIPSINYYTITLPKIDGHEARFSGMCRVNDSTALISASVEDTKDWNYDGPILGSYFCLLNTKERKVTAEYLLRDTSENVIREKIESVELYKTDKSGYEIFAIADNDDGKTKLFRIKLALVR